MCCLGVGLFPGSEKNGIPGKFSDIPGIPGIPGKLCSLFQRLKEIITIKGFSCYGLKHTMDDNVKLNINKV